MTRRHRFNTVADLYPFPTVVDALDEDAVVDRKTDVCELRALIAGHDAGPTVGDGTLSDHVRCLPLLLITLVAASGCGSEQARSGAGGGDGGGSEGGSLPASPCPHGERELADGSCLPAGSQQNGCAAGEWPDERGACVAAGLGPDDCGVGFEHDGDVGCAPILPTVPCGPGTWAIPGDSTCRGFTDCGAGPYPDGLPPTDVVYVDAATNPPYDGTATEPYATLQDAIDAAGDGDTIAIAGGTYDEPAEVLGKALTLWGRCASMVSVVADGAPAITFGSGSSGSVARGLGISGDGRGVVVSDAEGVSLHDLWLHDLTSDGVTAERSTAPTEVTLRHSLIESATGRGAYAVGAQLTLEELAIRDLLPNALGMGRAVDTDLQPTTGESNVVTVRRVHVARTQEVAIMVHASAATIADSFIFDTRPAQNGRLGRAINSQTDTPDILPSLTVTGSVIDQAHDGGIVGSSGETMIDRTVIRHIEPNLDDGFRGYGVAIQTLPVGGSLLEMRRSLVEAARETGILTVGAESLVELVVVRDMEGLTGVVHPSLPSSFGGRGVASQFDAGAGNPASLTIRGSVVDGTDELGIGAFGSELVVEGTSVIHTRPLVGKFGRGIAVQVHLDSGVRSQATLRESVVSDSVEVGVFVSGSSLVMEGVAVHDVSETALGINGMGLSLNHDLYFGHAADVAVTDSVVRDCVSAGVGTAGASLTLLHTLIERISEAPDLGGTFGDGVVAINHLGTTPNVVIHDSRVAGVDRGGVAVFGARVDLSSARIECAEIDLPTSTLNGYEADLRDLGGNVCGCGDATKICKVTGSMLEVPSPPEAF